MWFLSRKQFCRFVCLSSRKMSTISLNLSEHIFELLCLCEKIHQIILSKFQIMPNGFYAKWTYAKMALSQMTQTHLGLGLATTVTEKATFQNERNRQVHILTVKDQVPCGVWLVRLKPYYTTLLFTCSCLTRPKMSRKYFPSGWLASSFPEIKSNIASLF